MTPYILFVKEKRPEYCGTTKGKGMSFGEIMRHLADLWKSMSIDEKRPYIERSNVDKERHECEKVNLI